MSPRPRTGWPLKPELVLVGGNWAVDPGRTSVDIPDSLQLLTTALAAGHGRGRLLERMGDTSAAVD